MPSDFQEVKQTKLEPLFVTLYYHTSFTASIPKLFTTFGSL